MPYSVRTRFHHPDPSRNEFYQIGQTIEKFDEQELEKGGYLARNCTYTEDPPSIPRAPLPPQSPPASA